MVRETFASGLQTFECSSGKFFKNSLVFGKTLRRKLTVIGNCPTWDRGVATDRRAAKSLQLPVSCFLYDSRRRFDSPSLVGASVLRL